MASLDTYNKKYPENLERPDHIPNRIYLDRFIDAPYGSALYWDLPSLVVMYNLAKRAGRKEFIVYADNYLRSFLEKCVAKNGVFLWGNYYYYDAFIDKTVRFGNKPVPIDIDSETGDLHEMRPIAPAWDVFWKINPEATEKQIRQSAKNHLANSITGQFNRHADGKGRHAFLEAGGICMLLL